uniref:Uncharacterized protein n=1 Tax=Arion vulgaris TaxID=1028688 RepID=A0A0B6ZZN3_9EUPU
MRRTFNIFLGTFLVLAIHFNVCLCSSEWLIQTLEDDIGAENFTYYRLQRPGSLRLQLVSLHGDVDIYVSSSVSQPDYSNYDLKSESCGFDIISIPAIMSRPVYLGLFGHPNNHQSKYRLSIFEVDEPVVDDYEALVDKYYYEEMDGSSSKEPIEKDTYAKLSSRKSVKVDHREDERPLWWDILIDTLKFFVEVIL